MLSGDRQLAVGGKPVHRAQQVADPLRVTLRHQRQIDVVEREVATEREQPQPGVAVDVALADLDEPSAEGQQFQPGALCGAGQRVEHDVDAVSVGVAADLLGELDAARVVDMLDTHVAQQCSPLLAAGRGEDLGSRGAGDRDRRLPDAAGGGVDQHLVAGADPGQIVQAVPGGGVRGGHRGRLVVGQARRQRRGQAGVTGDERGPATVGGHAADVVTDLVVGDVGPDRGHHAGEIDAQLRRCPVEAGVPAERDQDVGEVDAGRGDRDLDLSGPGGTRSNAANSIVSRSPGVRICRRMPSCGVVHDGGSPLLGAQRCRAQARRVPLAVAPGGLVLVRAAAAVGVPAARRRCRSSTSIWVARRCGYLGADHPQQAAQPALLEIAARRSAAPSGRCGSRRTAAAARRRSPAVSRAMRTRWRT